MCEGGYLGKFIHVLTVIHSSDRAVTMKRHLCKWVPSSYREVVIHFCCLPNHWCCCMHCTIERLTAWKPAAHVRALAVEACMLCLLAFITNYLSHEAVFVVKLLLLTAMHPRTSAKIWQLLSAVPLMYEWHGGRIAWAWPFYSLHVLPNCLCKQHVASIWSVLSKKLMLSLATLGYSMLVFFSHHSSVRFMLWWAISWNRCWLCSKKESFWCVPVP